MPMKNPKKKKHTGLFDNPSNGNWSCEVRNANSLAISPRGASPFVQQDQMVPRSGISIASALANETELQYRGFEDMTFTES